MGLFSSLIGSGAGNTYTSTSTSAASGTLVVSNGTGISIGTHPGQYYNAAQTSFTEHHSKLYAVQGYADLIGWNVEHVYLPHNTTSSDPKVAILKLTTEGEVIKDVGLRIGNNFYIMREPKGDDI